MSLDPLRRRIRSLTTLDETEVLDELTAAGGFTKQERARIKERAVALIDTVRGSGRISPLNQVLSEYGLDTKEGVALMTLAEALLRIPDAATRDALIADKIGGQNWLSHMGASTPLLANAATAAFAADRRRSPASSLWHRSCARSRGRAS